MKAHGAGLLPKKNKTFTGFPLILGWIILLWNTFRTTFHQGQLLSRRFCRRGSSCRQTNSFPKLLFWQLAKRTWLNLEKLFSEWSGRGKKKKRMKFPSLFTLVNPVVQMAKLAYTFEGEMRICVHYISSSNSDSSGSVHVATDHRQHDEKRKFMSWSKWFTSQSAKIEQNNSTLKKSENKLEIQILFPHCL